MVFGTLVVGGLGYALSRIVGGSPQINTLIIEADPDDPEIGVVSVCNGLFDVDNFYLKLEPLGQGSFGKTYPLFKHRDDLGSFKENASYAIKLYRPHPDIAEADLKREILIQFEAAKESINITKILPVLLKRGDAFGCIMEVNEGLLSNYLTTSYKTPGKLINAFKLCLNALRNALKTANVIHFDLKFNNVMYQLSGTTVIPKIIDFGFAQRGFSDGDIVFYILSILGTYTTLDVLVREFLINYATNLLVDMPSSSDKVFADIRTCAGSHKWVAWHEYAFVHTGYYSEHGKNILGKNLVVSRYNSDSSPDMNISDISQSDKMDAAAKANATANQVAYLRTGLQMMSNMNSISGLITF
jgi:tRNA A-37 threonylcarbamoyl transferase component Bud32